MGNNTIIDNSAMNTLVYKYGEAAKTNNTTIVNEVMYGSGSTNTKDKVLVGNLTVDGSTCSDGNAATVGETWLNGICQGGTSTNGTPCNDNNSATYNDIYTNGVCAGVTNGTPCNDNNVLTFNDKYTNGICAGILDGTPCNDNNAFTINDVYTSGSCAGVPEYYAGTPPGLTIANKATFTYSMINSFWSHNGAGLFDQIVNPNDSLYAYDKMVYWGYYNGEDTTLEITVQEPFVVWRRSFYNNESYSGLLRIFKLESGSFVDRTSTYSMTTGFGYGSSHVPNSWESFTYTIPAGTYRFKAIDYQYRIDTEWFIQKK